MHRAIQLPLRFGSSCFKRRKAGRKPGKGKRPVPHRRRDVHDARNPVHVTISGLPEMVSFRRPTVYGALEDAIALAQRPGFRVIEFSVQSNHLHFVVEATDNAALSRGMKGLSVRLARAYNRRVRRRGTVWSGRYHAKELTSPRQVRRVLVYVLQNWKKARPWERALDDKSSAAWFGGWDEETREAFSGWARDRTRGQPWQRTADGRLEALAGRDSRTLAAAARRARDAGSPLCPVVAPGTHLLRWLWRARGGGEISMFAAPKVPEWDAFVPA
jgi:putative transposase